MNNDMSPPPRSGVFAARKRRGFFWLVAIALLAAILTLLAARAIAQPDPLPQGPSRSAILAFI